MYKFYIYIVYFCTSSMCRNENFFILSSMHSAAFYVYAWLLLRQRMVHNIYIQVYLYICFQYGTEWKIEYKMNLFCTNNRKSEPYFSFSLYAHNGMNEQSNTHTQTSTYTDTNIIYHLIVIIHINLLFISFHTIGRFEWFLKWAFFGRRMHTVDGDSDGGVVVQQLEHSLHSTYIHTVYSYIYRHFFRICIP